MIQIVFEVKKSGFKVKNRWKTAKVNKSRLFRSFTNVYQYFSYICISVIFYQFLNVIWAELNITISINNIAGTFLLRFITQLFGLVCVSNRVGYDQKKYMYHNQNSARGNGKLYLIPFHYQDKKTTTIRILLFKLDKKNKNFASIWLNHN